MAAFSGLISHYNQMLQNRFDANKNAAIAIFPKRNTK
jgi:hypothetical protein